VLKKGGVYVFTTVLSFEGETSPIPGCYLFTPQDLLGLIQQSPFHTEPIFDCRLTKTGLNIPIILDPSEYGANFYDKRTSPLKVVASQRGRAYTYCVLVLHKDNPVKPKETQIIGWEDARRFVNEHHKILLDRMWRDWQYLHSTEVGEVDLYTYPNFFGAGRVCFKAYLPCAKQSRIAASVVSTPRLVPRTDPQTVLSQTMDKSDDDWYMFSFDVSSDRCYSFRARVVGSEKTGETLAFAKKE
jgi:hypothetical protein